MASQISNGSKLQRPGGAVDGETRRPIGYWAEFNNWWRTRLSTHGCRPSQTELAEWFNAYAPICWKPEEMPSLKEVRTHAKCLRSTEQVRNYFRKYRAARRANSVTSARTRDLSDSESEGVEAPVLASGPQTSYTSHNSRAVISGAGNMVLGTGNGGTSGAQSSHAAATPTNAANSLAVATFNQLMPFMLGAAGGNAGVLAGLALHAAAAAAGARPMSSTAGAAAVTTNAAVPIAPTAGEAAQHPTSLPAPSALGRVPSFSQQSSAVAAAAAFAAAAAAATAAGRPLPSQPFGLPPRQPSNGAAAAAASARQTGPLPPAAATISVPVISFSAAGQPQHSSHGPGASRSIGGGILVHLPQRATASSGGGRVQGTPTKHGSPAPQGPPAKRQAISRPAFSGGRGPCNSSMTLQASTCALPAPSHTTTTTRPTSSAADASAGARAQHRYGSAAVGQKLSYHHHAPDEQQPWPGLHAGSESLPPPASLQPQTYGIGGGYYSPGGAAAYGGRPSSFPPPTSSQMSVLPPPPGGAPPASYGGSHGTVPGNTAAPGPPSSANVPADTSSAPQPQPPPPAVVGGPGGRGGSAEDDEDAFFSTWQYADVDDLLQLDDLPDDVLSMPLSLDLPLPPGIMALEPGPAQPPQSPAPAAHDAAGGGEAKRTRGGGPLSSPSAHGGSSDSRPSCAIPGAQQQQQPLPVGPLGGPMPSSFDQNSHQQAPSSQPYAPHQHSLEQANTSAGAASGSGNQMYWLPGAPALPPIRTSSTSSAAAAAAVPAGRTAGDQATDAPPPQQPGQTLQQAGVPAVSSRDRYDGNRPVGPLQQLPRLVSGMAGDQNRGPPTAGDAGPRSALDLPSASSWKGDGPATAGLPPARTPADAPTGQHHRQPPPQQQQQAPPGAMSPPPGPWSTPMPTDNTTGGNAVNAPSNPNLDCIDYGTATPYPAPGSWYSTPYGYPPPYPVHHQPIEPSGAPNAVPVNADGRSGSGPPTSSSAAPVFPQHPPSSCAVSYPPYSAHAAPYTPYGYGAPPPSFHPQFPGYYYPPHHHYPPSQHQMPPPASSNGGCYDMYGWPAPYPHASPYPGGPYGTTSSAYTPAGFASLPPGHHHPHPHHHPMSMPPQQQPQLYHQPSNSLPTHPADLPLNPPTTDPYRHPSTVHPGALAHSHAAAAGPPEASSQRVRAAAVARKLSGGSGPTPGAMMSGSMGGPLPPTGPLLPAEPLMPGRYVWQATKPPRRPSAGSGAAAGAAAAVNPDGPAAVRGPSPRVEEEEGEVCGEVGGGRSLVMSGMPPRQERSGAGCVEGSTATFHNAPTATATVLTVQASHCSHGHARYSQSADGAAPAVAAMSGPFSATPMAAAAESQCPGEECVESRRGSAGDAPLQPKPDAELPFLPLPDAGQPLGLLPLPRDGDHAASGVEPSVPDSSAVLAANQVAVTQQGAAVDASLKAQSSDPAVASEPILTAGEAAAAEGQQRQQERVKDTDAESPLTKGSGGEKANEQQPNVKQQQEEWAGAQPPSSATTRPYDEEESDLLDLSGITAGLFSPPGVSVMARSHATSCGPPPAAATPAAGAATATAAATAARTAVTPRSAVTAAMAGDFAFTPVQADASKRSHSFAAPPPRFQMPHGPAPLQRSASNPKAAAGSPSTINTACGDGSVPAVGTAAASEHQALPNAHKAADPLNGSDRQPDGDAKHQPHDQQAQAPDSARIPSTARACFRFSASLFTPRTADSPLGDSLLASWLSSPPGSMGVYDFCARLGLSPVGGPAANADKGARGAPPPGCIGGKWTDFDQVAPTKPPQSKSEVPLEPHVEVAAPQQAAATPASSSPGRTAPMESPDLTAQIRIIRYDTAPAAAAAPAPSAVTSECGQGDAQHPQARAPPTSCGGDVLEASEAKAGGFEELLDVTLLSARGNTPAQAGCQERPQLGSLFGGSKAAELSPSWPGSDPQRFWDIAAGTGVGVVEWGGM